jgi:hypothetical protein
MASKIIILFALILACETLTAQNMFCFVEASNFHETPKVFSSWAPTQFLPLVGFNLEKCKRSHRIGVIYKQRDKCTDSRDVIALTPLPLQVKRNTLTVTGISYAYLTNYKHQKYFWSFGPSIRILHHSNYIERTSTGKDSILQSMFVKKYPNALSATVSLQCTVGMQLGKLLSLHIALDPGYTVLTRGGKGYKEQTFAANADGTWSATNIVEASVSYSALMRTFIIPSLSLNYQIRHAK